MKSDPVYVTKMSGDKVLFDENKLRRSLKRSQADDDSIEHVISKIRSELYDSIPTKEIYKLAFSQLRKSASHSASRYKLKRAILELGPTGFPFEKFIAELLKFRDYKTQVGVFVQGHCVMHEIDIVAEKEAKHLMIECKFHSDQRRFCDVKVPLYIYSRFKDVETKLKLKSSDHKTYLCGLVTNTRFTSDALQYGKCMDMFMLSWDYPADKSLKLLIDQAGLYPITSLLSLSNYEKNKILDTGIVLCRDLLKKQTVLESLQIPEIRMRKIIEELQSVSAAHAGEVLTN